VSVKCQQSKEKDSERLSSFYPSFFFFPSFELSRFKILEEEEDSSMTIGVEALPLTFVAHALAVAGAVTVLVWNLYYRGGLAWEATNKSLIFNVSLSLMLSSFYFGSMDSFLGVFFCVCVFILVFRSFFCLSLSIRFVIIIRI